MRSSTPLLALLAAFALLAPQVSEARNIYPARIPNGTVNSCLTCHNSARGGGARNPFGNAFNNGGRAWTADLALADSDGDGFTNGEELLDPAGEWSAGDDNPGNRADVTLPGNANSHPPEDVDPPDDPEGCRGDQPAVQVGGACASDGDCGVGGTCVDDVKGGYCTVIEEDGVRCCPEGSTAFEIEDGVSHCFKDCAQSSDCRDGDDAFQYCDDDNTCVGCWIPAIEVGASCEEDGDCGEGGTCLTDEGGYAFNGGYCAIDWNDYCCAAGSEPVDVGDDDDTVPYCMLSCGADGDCREDEDYLCDNEVDVCWPLEFFGEDGGDEGEDDGADDGAAAGAGDEAEGDGAEDGAGEAGGAAADAGGAGDGGGEVAPGEGGGDGEVDGDAGGAADGGAAGAGGAGAAGGGAGGSSSSSSGGGGGCSTPAGDGGRPLGPWRLLRR